MVNILTIYKQTPYLGEIHCGLKDLPRMLKHDDMNMNPPYQRKSVWTVEQQELFMGHMLSGGDLLPIIVQRVPESGHSEILDGKQRVEAMLAWLNEKIGARLLDGRLVFRSEVEGPFSRVGFRIKYINLPFEQRKDFYVRLNSAGTPHTKEDLEHAMQAKEDLEQASEDLERVMQAKKTT